MINNIDEAIAHCHEKAGALSKKMNCTYYRQGSHKDDLKKIIEERNECLQLADWLEELKARREADRWIPVSERLPDKDEYYLVVVNSGQPLQLISFYEAKYKRFNVGIFDKVTHWRPIPEYKESEDG